MILLFMHFHCLTSIIFHITTYFDIENEYHETWKCTLNTWRQQKYVASTKSSSAVKTRRLYFAKEDVRMLPQGRRFYFIPWDRCGCRWEERTSSAQSVNKSTVARRAIKSTAIGLCNLHIRVREIERKGGGESTEVGDREAAEITAIIAIEVRTDRCLLNPIGNRREVEHDLLPRFRVPIPDGREREGGGKRNKGKQGERCSPRKMGGLRRLTRELTGRIPRNGATTRFTISRFTLASPTRWFHSTAFSFR